MARKILIPVDLNHTDALETVFAAALENAQPQDASILLINVVPALNMGDFPYVETHYLEQMVAKAQQRLEQIGQERIGGKFEWQAEVVSGSPGRAIVRFADEHDVDLIVMASHNPAFTDIVFGSVADQVVKRANHSVFVVRQSGPNVAASTTARSEDATTP